MTEVAVIVYRLFYMIKMLRQFGDLLTMNYQLLYVFLMHATFIGD